MAFLGYGEPYSESSDLSHQSPVPAIDNPIIDPPPNALQQPQQETAGGTFEISHNGPPDNDAPKSAPVRDDIHGTEGAGVLVPKSSISKSHPRISVEHHDDLAPPLEYEGPVVGPAAQDVEHQPHDEPTLDNINASEQDDTNDQDDGNQQQSANNQQDARPNVQGAVQNVHRQNHVRNQLEQRGSGNQRKKKRWHWLIPVLLALIFSLGTGVVGICYAVVEHPTANPQNNKHCQLYYILSLDSVQCGVANSHEYAEIEIEGVLRSGDTLQGTVRAWVIPEVDLKLFASQYPPASHNISTSIPKHILLPQLEDIYLWVNSTVYGNCCIVNHGSTKTNALLNIFTDNDDVQNFEKGIIPKSDVLYENITIPPHGSQCFNKWGPDSPLQVNISSYYYIGISVSANTALYTNVTITQLLVNTSGYGPPHYIGSDNSTVFTLSSGNNTAICEAPPSLETPSSDVGAESLHVQTCNEPKQAQAENPAMYFVIVGVLFALCGFTLLVVFCLLCFFISQKCKKRELNDLPNYGAIGSTDNLIQ